MPVLIAPSILSADFGNLQRDIEMINNSQADWFHIDVMDGVFVPNISFGFPVLKAVQKHAKKVIDCHLMVKDADPYLTQFKELGATNITVHFEAVTHLHRTIQAIKALGCTAGVALNPHTPVSVLEDIVQDLDLILIMSVNPGFGGQKFITNSLKKVKEARALVNAKQTTCLIQVDGGVDLTNCKALYQAGADVLVAGNAVFGSANPAETILKMKE